MAYAFSVNKVPYPRSGMLLGVLKKEASLLLVSRFLLCLNPALLPSVIDLRMEAEAK